jgi:hypothetical protein
MDLIEKIETELIKTKRHRCKKGTRKVKTENGFDCVQIKGHKSHSPKSHSPVTKTKRHRCPKHTRKVGNDCVPLSEIKARSPRKPKSPRERKRCPKHTRKVGNDCVPLSEIKARSPRKPKSPKSPRERKRCPKHTRKVGNDCVPLGEIKAKSPRKKKNKFIVSDDDASDEAEWDDNAANEWKAIIDDLKTGKMKKMGYGTNDPSKPCPPPDCKSCLKTLPLEDLKEEVAKRSEVKINILIPRKKNPVPPPN